MISLAHIADIHWRGLSRHAEFREVLQAFVDDVKERGIEHIFVAGDIFHTKTSGLSPEYIDHLTWWLKSMAAVATVHITLGNHDGNLVNLSRQDAITPIVDALKEPNIHLYKYSGVYPIAPGYELCIFSLFDTENWKLVKPVAGCVNIASYHGPVAGARSDTDWVVEDGLNLEFFKDYDFVLLGDIHKMQFLSMRQVEIEIDESDLRSYPGAEIIND